MTVLILVLRLKVYILALVLASENDVASCDEEPLGGPALGNGKTSRALSPGSGLGTNREPQRRRRFTNTRCGVEREWVGARNLGLAKWVTTDSWILSQDPRVGCYPLGRSKIPCTYLLFRPHSEYSLPIVGMRYSSRISRHLKATTTVASKQCEHHPDPEVDGKVIFPDLTQCSIANNAEFTELPVRLRASGRLPQGSAHTGNQGRSRRCVVQLGFHI